MTDLRYCFAPVLFLVLFLFNHIGASFTSDSPSVPFGCNFAASLNPFFGFAVGLLLFLFTQMVVFNLNTRMKKHASEGRLGSAISILVTIFWSLSHLSVVVVFFQPERTLDLVFFREVTGNAQSMIHTVFTPGETRGFLSLVWDVFLAESALRLLLVAIKATLLLLPGPLRRHAGGDAEQDGEGGRGIHAYQMHKRLLLTSAELVFVLWRSVLPVPVWLQYLSFAFASAPEAEVVELGGVEVVFSVVTVAYCILKAALIFHILRAAAMDMSRNCRGLPVRRACDSVSSSTSPSTSSPPRSSHGRPGWRG